MTSLINEYFPSLFGLCQVSNTLDKRIFSGCNFTLVMWLIDENYLSFRPGEIGEWIL